MGNVLGFLLNPKECRDAVSVAQPQLVSLLIGNNKRGESFWNLWEMNPLWLQGRLPLKNSITLYSVNINTQQPIMHEMAQHPQGGKRRYRNIKQHLQDIKVVQINICMFIHQYGDLSNKGDSSVEGLVVPFTSPHYALQASSQSLTAGVFSQSP